MNGALYEMFTALDTDTQRWTIRTAGTAALLVIVAAACTYWRRSRARAAADEARVEAEFGPLLAWVGAHQASWPTTREQRAERRRQWQEENRKTAGGRHRHPETPPAPGSPEHAVDRAFTDVCGDLPTATVPPFPAVGPVVGTAQVPLDVEAVIAAVRAECGLDAPPRPAANDQPTTLIPAFDRGAT